LILFCPSFSLSFHEKIKKKKKQKEKEKQNIDYLTVFKKPLTERLFAYMNIENYLSLRASRKAWRGNPFSFAHKGEITLKGSGGFR